MNKLHTSLFAAMRIGVAAPQRFLRDVSRIVVALTAMAILLPAYAEDSRNGLQVTVPNGYANITVDDMRVKSTAGTVRWMRVWDGQEWKFNPQWESLSQSWKNLTGSQSADTTGSTIPGAAGGTSGGVLSSSGSGSGGGSGCWVWVDEDWQPSTGSVLIGGIPQAGPMLPIRTTPFNRVMGEDSTDYPLPQLVSVDYASLCAGSSISGGSVIRDTEGIRRANELYLGGEGRYAFNNRAILEKRSVRQLPTATAAAQYASLAAGQMSLAPVTNAKGYRWIDKGGDWIDYNTQGQVVAWGDKNDNLVWLVRDLDGVVRGVVDANGHVIYSLHYNGQLITEIKDYPVAGLSQDLPARSVKYKYDANNRLTQITDVRGNIIQYDYDAGNHIIKITDQEGRVEQLTYSGDMVKQRTAPDGAVTDYAFEYDDTNKQFASKITGPETAAGRRVEDFTHNRVGKLVRRIVNGRTEEEIRYDTGARATVSTNARGFATRTTRNEFDQVVQIDQPDGSTVKRSYSALQLGLTEETDELGIKTQYQYDSKGNLTKKIEAATTADERITEYTRNSLGQATKATRNGRTEANGSVTLDASWQVEYDTIGQIKKTTDPEGNVRQYNYDRAGNLVSTIDPHGNNTRYEINADGNLINITDALGRIYRYQYDKVGNQISFIDARGKAVQTAYDAMNRNTQIVNSVGGVYKQQYNGQGQLILVTDEDGRTNQIEYDNFLALIRQVDAAGNATQYNYRIADGSTAGQLGSLAEPNELIYPTFTQQIRFDQRERPTSQSLKNSNNQGQETLTSTTTYDKRGQIKSETDANGNIRTYSYDALGHRFEIVDSLGGRTTAKYDARGNLLQLTDAKGNVHSFEYDRNSRIVKQTLPLGQTTRLRYDAAGNLVEKVDPSGNKFVYTFDAGNRLTELKQTNANGTLLRTTTPTWDANNNLTAWRDTDHGRGQTTNASATFDDANRKIGETITYPTGNTLSYSYAYSAAGKKTQLTWPDGTQIGYSYSAHGELESVSIPGEGTISINQYKWIAPEKTTLPGGSTQNKTYDGLLNLEGFKVKTPGQQSVLELSHQYGRVQELKSRNRTDTVNSTSSTKSNSYQYDSEIRLTQATTDSGGVFGADTESFTLDGVGNRIVHSKQNGAWTYDANNRLMKRGGGNCGSTDTICYDYDDAGNLIKATEGAKVTQYGYDSQNRLIEVKDSNYNLIARYGYDPLGRRIWKEQFRGINGVALAQAERTYYLYADEGLIAEASQHIALNADQTVTASGSPTVGAQYGPRPNALFTTGVLFVKTRNSNGQDSYAYYQHDHLETPVQATDKQGNVVWAAEYEPFGRAKITTPNPTLEKPTIVSNLRFPGQYEDQETGLHYNYFRTYDPNSGRYIQSDPIGLNGGVNSYAYVNGSPVVSADSFGLCDNKKKCKGRARVFQGNRNLIGKGGGFNGSPPNLDRYGVTADSAAVAGPLQWVDENGAAYSKSYMRENLDSISGEISGSNGVEANFGRVRDIMDDAGVRRDKHLGSTREFEEMLLKREADTMNGGDANFILIELPGIQKDLGMKDIVLSIPSGMACPKGTTEVK